MKLPDSLRLPQYRGAGLDRIKGQMGQSIPIDAEVEKQVLAAQFRMAQKGLPAGDPFLAAALGGRSPEVAAEALVNGTTIGSVAARKALLDGGASAIAASNDPMIVLARTVNPMATRHALRALRLNAVISANVELVGQAIYAAYGESLPPDATFTLRISDGVVKGFPYNGTIAPYKTSFYGMFAHNAEFDGQAPFNLPARWLAARAAIDMSAPLDFVSTADIIGGNSGSPVINRNGEVVGLIFDGNIEMLPNRFIYTDEVASYPLGHTPERSSAPRGKYGEGRLWATVEIAGPKAKVTPQPARRRGGRGPPSSFCGRQDVSFQPLRLRLDRGASSHDVVGEGTIGELPGVDLHIEIGAHHGASGAQRTDARVGDRTFLTGLGHGLHHGH